MRLFIAGAIALDTVVLHPLVGAFFATLNQRRLGDREGMRRTLRRFMAPAALMAIVQGGFVFGMWPPDFRGAALWTYELVGFAIELVMARSIYREQKPIVTKHLEEGGQKSGFSFDRFLVLCLVFVLVVLFNHWWQTRNHVPLVGTVHHPAEQGTTAR